MIAVVGWGDGATGAKLHVRPITARVGWDGARAGRTDISLPSPFKRMNDPG